MLVRLSGRASSVRLCGRLDSVRLTGRAKPPPGAPVVLARLLGRLPSNSLPPRFETGPKLRRLMPEVLMRETCLVVVGFGVSSPPFTLLVALIVLPPVRLRLRIVIEDGI